MVAPSFVTMVSPEAVRIILSMPRGPSEVRTTSATAFAACMLLCRTSTGFSLPMNVPTPLPCDAGVELLIARA